MEFNRFIHAPISVLTALGIVLLSILSWVSDGVHEMLGLKVAGAFTDFRIWTIVSFVFLECNAFLLVLNVLVLLSAGVYIEQSMRQGYFRFILAVATFSGFVTFFTLIFVFVITGREVYIFRSLYSFSAPSTALVVALKQKIPNLTVFPNVPKLEGYKVRHLPFTMLSAFIVLGFLSSTSFAVFLLSQVFSGFVGGWTYLRFIHKDVITGIVGDPSDEFRFALLFPWILQPPAKLVGTIVHSIFQSIGLLSPTAKRSFDEESMGDLEPTTDPAAERRRALAVEMINQKLSGKLKSGESQ